MYASKDGVSDTLIDLVSKENAIEDTISLVKACFRKKTIDLETYLDNVRELAEEQFYNLSMKRKLLTLLKQSS